MSKSVEPNGQTLSEAHKTRIDSVFPEYREELAKGGDANPWIDAKATVIWDSDVFEDVRAATDLSAEEDPKLHQAGTDKMGRPLFAASTWLALIKKKIRNHSRTKLAAEAKLKGLGRATTSATPTTSGGIANATHFFRRKLFTGRNLFETEHKAAVEAEAGAKAKAAGDEQLAHYQPVLKEKWNGLSDQARENYNVRAARAAKDVGVNQAAFAEAMMEEMNGICSEGLIGYAEIVVMYAYREPSGKLVTGDIQAHSSRNSASFSETTEWPAMVSSFQSFARSAVPAPLANWVNDVEIKCNAEGVPIFPQCDVNAMTIVALRGVLKAFITRLWSYRQSTESPVPWANLPSHDTNAFVLPTRLRDPTSMSNAQAIELVEYFMALAKSPDHAAFKFLSGDLPEEEISDGGSGGSGAQEGEEDERSGGGDGKDGEPLKKAGSSDGGNGNMAPKGKTAGKVVEEEVLEKEAVEEEAVEKEAVEEEAVEKEAVEEEAVEEEAVGEEAVEEDAVEDEVDVAEKSKKVTKKGKAKKVANRPKKSTGGAKAKTALAGGEGPEDETEGAHTVGNKRKRVTTQKPAEDGPPVKKSKKAVVAAEDPVAEGRPRRVRAPTKARAAPMSPLAKNPAAGKAKAPGRK